MCSRGLAVRETELLCSEPERGEEIFATTFKDIRNTDTTFIQRGALLEERFFEIILFIAIITLFSTALHAWFACVNSKSNFLRISSSTQQSQSLFVIKSTAGAPHYNSRNVEFNYGIWFAVLCPSLHSCAEIRNRKVPWAVRRGKSLKSQLKRMREAECVQ